MLIASTQALKLRRGWLPTDLGSSLKLWIDPSDSNTLFTSNAGTGGISSGASIGYAADKSGNGFHLTSAADDGTRPTFGFEGGVSYIRFDGTDDQLRRSANLNLLGTNGLDGAFTIGVAIKRSSAPNADTTLVAEGNTGASAQFHRPIATNSTTGTTAEAFLRNDDGAVLTYTTGNLTTPNGMQTGAHTLIVTDTTTLLASYLNGEAIDTHSYSRLDGAGADIYTMNNFSVGALWRSTISQFWTGDLISLVAINRVLGASEITTLDKYLKGKAGLAA